MVKLEEIGMQILNAELRREDFLCIRGRNFKSLLSLVKEFIVNVWKVRKQKLYSDDSYSFSLGPHLAIWGCRWG